MDGLIELNAKPGLVLVPGVLGLVVKNFKWGLKIAVGPLGEWTLGLVGGGGDMMDSPAETSFCHKRLGHCQ